MPLHLPPVLSPVLPRTPRQRALPAAWVAPASIPSAPPANRASRRRMIATLAAATLAGALPGCGGSARGGTAPAPTDPGGTTREPAPYGGDPPPAEASHGGTPHPVTVIYLPADPQPGERFSLGAEPGAHWRLVPNPGQAILTDGLSGDVQPGERWVDIPLHGAWSTAAASHDGRWLMLAANHGPLFLSGDEGQTWQRQPAVGEAHWTSVALAPTGLHMAAASFGGRLWISRDEGASWRACSEPRDWVSVAISEDGYKVVALTKDGGIHSSDDGGEIWTVRSTGPQRWQSLAATPSGAHLLAGASDGALWSSAHFGSRWQPLGVQQPWSRTALSQDGQILAAATWGSFVQLSTDAGESWTPVFREGPVSALAMSSDGRRLLLTVPAQPGLPDGRPHLSLDGGLTWQAQLDDRTWMAAAISGDGRTLLAAHAGPDTDGSAGGAAGGIRVSVGNRTRYGPAGSISGGPGGWLDMFYEGDGRFRITDADPGPHQVA